MNIAAKRSPRRYLGVTCPGPAGTVVVLQDSRGNRVFDPTTETLASQRPTGTTDANGLLDQRKP